jgi:hypothetical protein
VSTRRLVAAGLLFLVAFALAPAPAGGAASRHAGSQSTGGLLAEPAEATPAVVGEIAQIEWRPAQRSTRIPFPIVLVSIVGAAALLAGACAQVRLGTDTQAPAIHGHPWRGRAPPVRFSPRP